MAPLNNRYFSHFDWVSFLLIIILAGIGLASVLSATYQPGAPFSIFFKKQFIGCCVGIGIYLACSALDYRVVIRWANTFYAIVIALLLFTIIKGSIGMGARRWINLLFFKLQPSELTKLFFPAFMAHYFSLEKNSFTASFYHFVPVLAVLLPSFLLILKQPDLGTALLLLFSGLILLWLAGINKKFFIYSAIAITITAPLLWHCLKPYQKKRITVFLGQGDNRKERYQIEQSKIAIGSGGLTGKGFLKGTQNKLSFLPEGRTDFIFSVIAEELGFLGVFGLLCIYLLLFLRLLIMLRTITDPIAQLFGAGLIIHIMLSTIINIGMVLGLLPIVGIPLPLVSYGISNLWITFASLGLFHSICLRRFAA